MLNEIRLKANQHLVVSGSYTVSCRYEMPCDKCALFDDINENKICKKIKMVLL